MSKTTETKIHSTEEIQAEIARLLSDDTGYLDSIDERNTELTVSRDLRNWIKANSSRLCSKQGASLTSYSVYAHIRAIKGNVLVYNAHNKDRHTEIHGDIFAVKEAHYYGLGAIEKASFGLFVVSNETSDYLRVSYDKTRGQWQTTSEQYFKLYGGFPTFNIEPGRLLIRGLRQLGTDHYTDNKADGSDMCLDAALLATQKVNGKVQQTGYFANGA